MCCFTSLHPDFFTMKLFLGKSACYLGPIA